MHINMQRICFIFFCWVAGVQSAFAQDSIGKREFVRVGTDSVDIAGSGYFRAGWFKKKILGSNYRREWRTAVRVKIFNMSQFAGGLTPLERGGGHQTKSLRLVDRAGKQYVLRSIEKEITQEAVPQMFRQTFVRDLMQDGVSASYPYASLSVPPLADAAGVRHATPQLVFVPDDEALGSYKAEFGNQLFLFEEREPIENGRTINTVKLSEELLDDNRSVLDQHAFLRARLFDMFILDFDRHEDQWRWGRTGEGKNRTYYPIPRDRDQAFFINKGFLPRMASKDWVSPQLQGLRPHARNIRTFNFNAIQLDRLYLNGVTQDEWRAEAERMVKLMTDSIINVALQQQPSSIYPLSAPWIAQTLKSRHRFFVDEAISYYKFLAKEVNVLGSDKDETFTITNKSNGSVTVLVERDVKKGQASREFYKREFFPSETKEIRLYGMGGNDQFTTIGSAKTGILVRIIGGLGNDTISNEAGLKNLFAYDLSTESNLVKGPAVRKLSSDSSINYFNPREFRYNVIAPFVLVNYNVDDGVFLGLSFKYTRHGFRKQPFKSQQRLVINHALATSAYNFAYTNEMISLLGSLDLLLGASVQAPHNTINFFGYGNSSVYDKTVNKRIAFYRARYTSGDFNVMLRKRWSPSFSISAGPSFRFFSIDSTENDDRYIAQLGLAPREFRNQQYAGAQILIDFDTRSDKIIPASGIRWQTSFNYNGALNKNSFDYSRLSSALSLFTSFSRTGRVVLATRFGGGINFGTFGFSQSQFLGGTDNLRGFRNYRFAGEKMAYNNTEVRIRVLSFQTYLFPGSLGVLLFNDVGRVWYDGDDSEKWHDGYGAGIWISPINRLVVTASYMNSVEGGLPLVTFGFQF